MNLQIQVTVRARWCGSTEHSATALTPQAIASIRQAIDTAVRCSEDEGFTHPLENSLSLHIVDTEVVQDTVEDLRKAHLIMLGTARRCARDLRHAVDHIDPEYKELFLERFRNYETIFADLREYRIQLCNEIDNLRRNYERKEHDVTELLARIEELKKQRYAPGQGVLPLDDDTSPPAAQREDGGYG